MLDYLSKRKYKGGNLGTEVKQLAKYHLSIAGDMWYSFVAALPRVRYCQSHTSSEQADTQIHKTEEQI